MEATTERPFLVRTEKLSKFYQQGEEIIKALDQVELSISPGEWVAVTGASGSGKSTLLNMLGLLDSPSEGVVFLEEIPATSLGASEKRELRLRKLGFVFQFFNLQANLCALENVMLPAWLATGDRRKSTHRATTLLERVGLGARLQHLPAQLSGGQQQKVAIARAVVNSPALILADEPTGNLDSSSSTQIMKLFSELNSEGHTIIMVTHEPDIAARAHRELVLHDGRLLTSRTSSGSL
jgi:putative ABC transport system ATP-binding protein